MSLGGGCWTISGYVTDASDVEDERRPEDRLTVLTVLAGIGVTSCRGTSLDDDPGLRYFLLCRCCCFCSAIDSSDGMVGSLPLMV